MYYRLKEGILNSLIERAIKKAGTIRRLAKEVNIPKSTLYNNYKEYKLINKNNLIKIENYLNKHVKKEEIIEELPDNWKQIIGGKNCVKKKQENNTLNSQLKKARQKLIDVGKSTATWHKKMKKENPDKYHLIQYGRFKKIGEYKFTTKKGEKVRNKLEKDTADFLFDNNIQYLYEPMIKINKHYFFPDFLINNKIIIECTFWRGYDKAIKLKNKINYLKKRYKVFVLIPKALNNYYQILNKYLIYELNTKDLVAQSVEHLTVRHST